MLILFTTKARGDILTTPSSSKNCNECKRERVLHGRYCDLHEEAENLARWASTSGVTPDIKS